MQYVCLKQPIVYNLQVLDDVIRLLLCLGATCNHICRHFGAIFGCYIQCHVQETTNWQFSKKEGNVGSVNCALMYRGFLLRTSLGLNLGSLFT